ncbi:MAG: hypothetical protein A2381_12615 [Bdellovibrionales bacterium RIFOXYB1_FULL_37_110]|nr:MAG: hypothetical protein A2181_07340 [Bdellovibrionales bacterium RIFOXYA1_FULL_38_20]OFZ51525.1 MAG: hypothetical protein A2417_12300 [Bdellovibrionales bacterium RIFOXYC1_FULL_37_79]OFZ60359.1 MAG: hypothetical protein A2381_12615 [Bdellovibrionales bacterium RIFOXYB1_FULL_37_110]OFZ63849.1 MAG: hypothetical protein A2577_05530 [Bdellovibrionales bacterium RIFOXYD1_FULL_36_51]
MNKTKILYVSANGYVGGAEQFVFNALQGHLQSPDFQCELLCFNDGPLLKKCQHIGIVTYLLPRPFRLSRIHTLLRAMIYLRKFVISNNYKIIHSTMPYSFIVMFLATCFLNLKHIWFQHGPVGGILDYVANFFKPDIIYFNSTFLASEHLKMPLSKRLKHLHKIIHLGIPLSTPDKKKIEELKLQFKNNKPLLLSAGRITPSKGYHTIIETMKLLVNDYKTEAPQIHLLIIGNTTYFAEEVYLKKLKGLVTQYQLEKYVTFLNHVDDLYNYMHISNIYIQATTIPESFGLAVAEAMAQKCLVIGPDFGGVKSILKNHETGLSFASNSVNAHTQLAFILKDILEQKIATNHLIENAYTQITNHYSMDQMIKILEDDYQTL